MHKVTTVALSLGMLLLAACGSGSSKNSRPLPTVTPLDASGSETSMTTPFVWPTEIPPATLEGHALGPDNAILTIVLYGDFQSEICARYARDLEILRSRYPDDVRLIWRHLPDIRTHDKAALALQASEAAAAQGFFWQMHDQLFTHQADWIALSPEEFRILLSQYAGTVGLDVARFNTELDNGTYAPMVDMALRDAADLQIVGSPTLLYNGVPYSGRDDLFGLEEGVRLALLEKRFFPHAPDITIDPEKTYRATIVTEKGNIVIDLFPRDALVAVNNFIFLAQSGWYDNTTFFYVVPGYLAQAGDPSDTGGGGPGYTIPDEHHNGLIFDREGLVAMAHPVGIADSAGSQFFITLAPLRPANEWDGQYTIFGIVVQGMDVVHNLTPRDPNDPIRFPNPPPGDRITTITIEETGP
jgi:cyclophilin family peptidyl-prolyl cis-trans isomerase/predicted DsbA family dithiol-disulfide isomerase